MLWQGCCARLPGSTALSRMRPSADTDSGFWRRAEDLLLLDDLLGIADHDVALPKIDPDARRRRLTALVNAASLAREAPAVFVIEDAHWIDPVSESMLAEFFAVIPQTASMVLVTYRPEYRGALSRVRGAQTIALAPLTYSESAALSRSCSGRTPRSGGWPTQSPIEPQETRFSPKRWCVSWPSAACSTVTAATTDASPTLPR